MIEGRRGAEMKRKRTIMAALICAAAVLSGCGGENGMKRQADGARREELVIWSYFETQAQRQSLDHLIRDFNQSQNEYQASWEYVPMTGFNKRLSSAYTENSLPDMAILDNPDMPLMIRLGMFEDITEQVEEWKVEEEYYPAIVETTRYEGRYYGVPFDCNNTGLIYNTKLLEEAGLEPPSTWEELRHVAAELSTPERGGFLMCGIEGEQGAFQILSWILAAGEDPLALGGEGTEAAFAFLESLIREGSLPENCINLTQTDVAREFVEGRAAMIQNGPWVFPILDEAGIEYGIAPIPDGTGREAGKTETGSGSGQEDGGADSEETDTQRAGDFGAAVVGGENIGVLKGKNLEGSLKFIRFCVESDALVSFCREANVLPGRIDSARTMVEGEEQLQVFERQMHTAVTRTSIPHWATVSQKLTDGLFQLVSQGKSPAEIAADFAVE